MNSFEQGAASLFLLTGELGDVPQTLPDSDPVGDLFSPSVDSNLDTQFIAKLTRGRASGRFSTASAAKTAAQPDEARDGGRLEKSVSNTRHRLGLAGWIRDALAKGETVESLAAFATAGGSPHVAQEIREIAADL